MGIIIFEVIEAKLMSTLRFPPALLLVVLEASAGLKGSPMGEFCHSDF